MKTMRIMLHLSILFSVASLSTGQPSTDAPSRPFAPAAITGRVEDADLNAPIEYANVIIYIIYPQRDSTVAAGTVTRADGRFAITGLRPGRYRIEVSFIGYQTWRNEGIRLGPGETYDVGRVTLQQRAVAVEGTEVTAERPRLEFRIDKKVINVSQNPAAQGGTAVDALENAPGVKVDAENNVSLRGSSNFTVLIDGRPTLLDGSEALQQIPASTIENIEIITNPSAKHDPEGPAGIINVILKKQRQQGLAGILNLSGGIPERYGGNVLFNLRRGIAATTFGVNFDRMSFPGTRMVESWTRNVDTSGGRTDTIVHHVDSDGTSLFGHKFYGLRGGTELTLSPRDRLVLSARWGGRNGGRSQDATYCQWQEPGYDTTGYSGRTSSGQASRNLSANADFNHNFGRDRHDLTLRVDFNRHDRNSDDTTETRSASGHITTGRRISEYGPRHRLDAKADYTLPLQGENKIEAGYQGRFVWSRDRYEVYEYDTSLGLWQYRAEFEHISDFRYDINSLYATWSANISSLGFQLGIRGEQTSRAIDTRESTFNLNQWDVFPTLHVSYGLPAELQLMTSYTRRIDRPGGWDLEPFESWMDAHNVRRGNPGLRNEYTDAIEAGVIKPFGANRISLDGYYRITHDLIQRVSSIYPGKPDVMLRTVDNVGTDYSLGAELSVDISPLRWWNLTLEGDFFNYRLRSILSGGAAERTRYNWQMSIGADFHLPTETRIQLRGHYESPSIEAQGTQGASFGTSIALRQMFLRRSLTATLQVRDLFTTGGHSMVTQGNDFYTRAEFRPRSPVASLGLTWNFNNHRLDRRQRQETEEHEEDLETAPEF